MVTVRQLFDRQSCTYTYFLYDESSKSLTIIDPVDQCFERDVLFIKELELELKYILETHIHADHITSSHQLKNKFGGEICISSHAQVKNCDKNLNDNDQLICGDFSIKVIETPGHTNTCLSYYTENYLFTGDTLFVRGCGRTDFQSGDSTQLYKSIHEKIFTLPNETIIFPGHDYSGCTQSTILEEKKYNPRVNQNNSLKDFQEIMENLTLPQPKMINIAVPANLKCGLKT